MLPIAFFIVFIRHLQVLLTTSPGTLPLKSISIHNMTTIIFVTAYSAISLRVGKIVQNTGDGSVTLFSFVCVFAADKQWSLF